jgi:multiple sugar transport system substrate-binding protein
MGLVSLRKREIYMKWLFVSVFGVLVAWSVWAWSLVPPPVEAGRTKLVWMSDDNPVRREQIALFNERHPEYLVTLDSSGLTTAKVIVQCIGGVGPDFFDIYSNAQLNQYVRAGVVLPLDEYAASMGFGLDKTWPTAREQIAVEVWNPQTERYERVQYAFPGNVNAPVIFYNKRIFREAGVPYPPAEWTWDEWLDTARKLSKPRADGRGYERFGMFLYEYDQLIEMFWQSGATMFDETRTYCTLDSPAARYALRFYYDMIHKYHAMPSPAQRDTIAGQGGWGGNWAQWFSQGQVAMIRAGRFALINFRQNRDLKGQIGVCHVPSRFADRKVVRLTSRSCGINPKSPNRAGALEFLAFLANEPFNELVVQSADAMPPVPKYADTEAFLHDPMHPEEDFNQFFIEAIERGRNNEICPFITPISVAGIVHRHLDLMHNGIKSPDAVLKDAAAEINEYIRRNLTKFPTMREEYHRRTGRAFDPAAFPPGRSEG